MDSLDEVANALIPLSRGQQLEKDTVVLPNQCMQSERAAAELLIQLKQQRDAVELLNQLRERVTECRAARDCAS